MMRFSNLFVTTQKQIAEEEVSTNAKLLLKWWYIDRMIAWVYTFLPFGNIVLTKIANIVREEMNNIWGNEVFMPTLASKKNWVATNRYYEMDNLFITHTVNWHELIINPSHEEVITPLVEKFVSSYKDLPCSVYQIQNKFRNEKRAKSWLLRWREFLMKDLYSFHSNEEDLDQYFDKVVWAYHRIFERLWVGDITFEVNAPGGDFSDKPSVEFQTLTEAWEDNIWFIKWTKEAFNEELFEEYSQRFEVKEEDNEIVEVYDNETQTYLEKAKAAESANIFKLYDKFSKDFGFYYADHNWEKQPVLMWCYWIWITRVMWVLVEVFHDDKGIKWPEHLAPYKYCIIPIGDNGASKAEEIYNKLKENKEEVIIDDRNYSPGYKFNDADLIGFPYKVVVSDKTLSEWEDKVELIKRSTGESKIISWNELVG